MPTQGPAGREAELWQAVGSSDTLQRQGCDEGPGPGWLSQRHTQTALSQSSLPETSDGEKVWACVDSY